MRREYAVSFDEPRVARSGAFSSPSERKSFRFVDLRTFSKRLKETNIFGDGGGRRDRATALVEDHGIRMTVFAIGSV